MEAQTRAADAPVARGEGLVVFGLEAERLAVPMEAVREIVRPQPMDAVPLAPPCLLGLTNLRGRVLPVADLRRLLGLPAREPDEATRVLVLEWRGAVLGLLVDRVLRVASGTGERLEGGAGVSRLLAAEALAEVVRPEGGELVQVLDLDGLLAGALGHPPATGGPEGGSGAGEGGPAPAALEDEGGTDAAVAPEEAAVQLVAFRAGGQELAVPLERVREIVRLPERVEAVPGAAAHALGLMPWRGATLPLLDLAAALGLREAGRVAQGARVLVAPVRCGARTLAVGLVVEGVREVLRVPEGALEEVPASMARGGHLEEIRALCRLDGGRRLVPVVAVERLEALAQLEGLAEAADGEASMFDAFEDEEGMERAPAEADEEDEIQLVVFQLEGEEYAVGVERVQEITRVPEQLSRVPRTPAWVEGLVSLRGAVLPVLDLRARLGLPRAGRSDRQRILVLDLDGVRTGFVADSVTEVLRVPRAALEQAPRLSEEQARLLGRVVRLDEGRRLVTVLEAEALLDEEERAALEAGEAA